jgi:hypothetical protein
MEGFLKSDLVTCRNCQNLLCFQKNLKHFSDGCYLTEALYNYDMMEEFSNEVFALLKCQLCSDLVALKLLVFSNLSQSCLTSAMLRIERKSHLHFSLQGSNHFQETQNRADQHSEEPSGAIRIHFRPFGQAGVLGNSNQKNSFGNFLKLGKNGKNRKKAKWGLSK